MRPCDVASATSSCSTVPTPRQCFRTTRNMLANRLTCGAERAPRVRPLSSEQSTPHTLDLSWGCALRNASICASVRQGLPRHQLGNVSNPALTHQYRVTDQLVPEATPRDDVNAVVLLGYPRPAWVAGHRQPFGHRRQSCLQRVRWRTKPLRTKASPAVQWRSAWSGRCSKALPGEQPTAAWRRLGRRLKIAMKTYGSADS